MNAEVVIQPFKSADNKGKKFLFGMTSAQLAEVDKQVFIILRDTNSGWTMEHRSGYRTELVDGQFVAIAFPMTNYDSVFAGDANFSGIENINRLKKSYEHYVYADGESVLFPELGVVYLVTPFHEGWEAPRPGVFNNDIIAFSKERLLHYRNLSHVLTLNPLKEVSIAGGTPIAFGMTQAQIQKCWGKPELVWDASKGANNHIVEYRYDCGIQLCYRDGKNWPLDHIDVLERDGWQIEVDGIRIFQDDKLEKIKTKYQFIESKKQKVVAFPKLGIMTVGCGEKKNSGKGADGKYIKLYGREDAPAFRYIDMYD